MNQSANPTAVGTTKSVVEMKGRFRASVPPVWQFLVAAAIFHLVITFGLSPSVFSGKGGGDSPEEQFKRAKAYEEEGKYEDAFKAYGTVVGKKPLVPAVFTDAEKKMNEMRLKSLQAKKDKPAAGDTTQKTGEPGKNGEKPGAAPDGKTPDKKAPVDLPSLPEIGQ